MDDDVDTNFCTLDTYEPYKSSNRSHHTHPDAIVETASLSSVVAPAITYVLRSTGALSNIQGEAVAQICQRHDTFLASGRRAGFLLGDGAGVGKGRTIAGVILENWLRSRRKAIWFSTSADLSADAIRDLNDVCGNRVPLYMLG